MDKYNFLLNRTFELLHKEDKDAIDMDFCIREAVRDTARAFDVHPYTLEDVAHQVLLDLIQGIDDIIEEFSVAGVSGEELN